MKPAVFRRILFWVTFSFLIAAVIWVGYHHLFGSGFFRPVIATETRIIDLGLIASHSHPETDITIINLGIRPLRIDHVRTGCAGCVEILSYPHDSIGWKQKATIRISLNTESLTGKVRKSFLIESNDPVRRVFPVLINAVVGTSSPSASPALP